MTFEYMRSICQSWFVAGVLSLNSSVAFITTKAGLARLRGFAFENADFEIFWTAKYLICKG